MDQAFLLVTLLVLYFTPFLLAFHRNHHQKLAIFFLNLFLGFTVLGWILAFVWAMTKVEKA